MQLTQEQDQLLKEALSVQSMAESEGWLQIIRPRLEAKMKNSWLDPREAGDDKDFFYRYTVAWANANAAKEILQVVDGYVDRVTSLRAKEKEEGPYRIGQ